MICGIKTKFITISKQSKLDWDLKVNEITGEEKPTKTYSINGLTFINKDGKTYLKGCLQTFFNNGLNLNNYKDFTYTDLVSTIKQIEKKININPAEVFLSNVEFGINIILPYSPENVINSLVIHKCEPFNKIPKSITKGLGSGVECQYKNYIIKIYDKGARCKQKQKILRIEIKAIKMAFFQHYNIPIQTLNNLLNIDSLKALGKILVNAINECLIVEPNLLIQENICESDRLILSNGSNAKYWLNLKPKSKDYPNKNKDKEYKRKRKKYYNELEHFENIISKYQQLNIKEQIIKLSRDKLTDLLTITRNKLADPILRIPGINGQSFRRLADKDSGNKRTIIPFCGGQSFRF